jgi:CHAD domain-containing protein
VQPANVGEALRDYALSELDAARKALASTDGAQAVHEGVHQARKSIRRTRAVLRMGDGILGPGAGLIDRELRALNTGLSQLRDAQALVETLQRLLAGKHKTTVHAPLERALAAAVSLRDACTKNATLLDPGLASRRAVLDVMHAALPALQWSRLTPSALRMAVADGDARTRQARERAAQRDRDEDWHRWRRRARRATHQRRALEAIGVDVKAAADAADKRIAERLGRAQDLTLLLDHCRRDSPFSEEDRAALRRYAKPALQRGRRRLAAAAHG